MNSRNLLSTLMVVGILASAYGQRCLTAQAIDPAKSIPGEVPHPLEPKLDFSATPPPRFEALNPGEKTGDHLAIPREMAAAIIAADKPNPHLVADLGSFTGEFLEAFMQRFPNSQGQWTEPVSDNEQNARIRLARFGDRVSYVVGCPARDISKGCIPKDADVIITSWVSIHQPLYGMARVYKGIYDQLPSGGWFANLDHVSLSDSDIEKPLLAARKEFLQSREGPPPHLWTPAPTLEKQLAAFKIAGFDDAHVVWCSFNDVLFMARKK